MIFIGDRIGDNIAVAPRLLFATMFLTTGDIRAAPFSSEAFSLPFLGDEWPDRGNNKVATGSFLAAVSRLVELSTFELFVVLANRFLPGVFINSDITGLFECVSVKWHSVP